MPDARIDPRLGHPLADVLGEINLKPEQDERQDPDAEGVRAHLPAQEFKNRAGGNHGMGQEKSFHPGCRGRAVQPLKRGRVERIPVKRKGADHDQNFNHHQPVQRRRQPLKNLFHTVKSEAAPVYRFPLFELSRM